MQDQDHWNNGNKWLIRAIWSLGILQMQGKPGPMPAFIYSHWHSNDNLTNDIHHDVRNLRDRPCQRLGRILRLPMDCLDEPPTVPMGAHIPSPRFRSVRRSRSRSNQKRSSPTAGRYQSGPTQPVDESCRHRDWQNSCRGVMEILWHKPVSCTDQEGRCDLVSGRGIEGSLRLDVYAEGCVEA